MSDEAIDVSLIIPTRNEGGRIKNTLARCLSYFKERNQSCEIWVVDGNSSDSTRQEVEEFQKTDARIYFIEDPVNLGKGWAVREGMLKSKGRIRLFLDADLATPIEEYAKMEASINNGFDVAIGSRGMPESTFAKRQPFFRELPGKAFRHWVHFWTGLAYYDTQCGFKMFTAKAAEDIFSKMKSLGFAFDVDILYLAGKLGYKTSEHPVHWKHFPSRARVFLTGWRTFSEAARVPQMHSDLK